MATILLTGGTGFIGSRLLRRGFGEYKVVNLARSASPVAGEGVVAVRGNFHSPADLGRLDGYRIDRVVHLAAVTGGCAEEDAVQVNIAGTRRLLRYLLDCGCRKFVLASSIAVAGCRNRRLVPQTLPIPSDHPCYADETYGLSKYAIEELTRVYHRQYDQADFIHLRLGHVANDETYDRRLLTPAEVKAPFMDLARVMCDDVLDAFLRALDAPPSPGVRVYNVVGPDVPSAVPVADALRAIMGERAAGLDLSYYEQAGKEYAPLYEIDSIAKELGCAPTRSVRPE